MTEGENTLTLTVFDEKGIVVGTHTIFVILDSKPLIIIITEPSNVQESSQPDIKVKETVNDPSSLYININETLVNIVNGGFNTIISLNKGLNKIMALAYDRDGNCGRDSITVLVINVNKAPITNAGQDQSVNEGVTVSLDGSASSDADGNPLTYRWTAPAGIILNSTNVVKPTFTAPEVKNDSILSFTLVVNDGKINSTPSTVKVTVRNVIKVDVSIIESPVIKVYPNPTTGIVNIELYENPGPKTGIAIYNILGKEIFRREFLSTGKFQIDLSNHVCGIYLIKITSDEQQMVKKLIISQ